MERDILCRLVAKLQAQSEPTCQNSMAGSKQRGQPTVRTQLRGLSSACATRCQGGLKICPQRSVLRSYPLEPSGQGESPEVEPEPSPSAWPQVESRARPVSASELGVSKRDTAGRIWLRQRLSHLL